jgi:two-component system, cell cycle response regulator
MHGQPQPPILLASNQPALLSRLEPVLLGAGHRVEIVLSAEAALAAMTAPVALGLALLDVGLPGIGMDQLLAATRADAVTQRTPIVLLANEVTEEWARRIEEGVIDDIILFNAEAAYIRMRLDLVNRSRERMLQIDQLRDAVALQAQTDALTGLYNRAGMLSMLFRETDRVQRTHSLLCMILIGIDDCGHWSAHLGEGGCDELLVQVVGRVTRLLRSYDLFGRVGKDNFLVALPGCSPVNAVMLAERLRLEVFTTPFPQDGQSIRLSACFGLVPSHGRSPVVVLREAEQVLQWARECGPESIKCTSDYPEPHPAPIAFLSADADDDRLAW